MAGSKKADEKARAEREALASFLHAQADRAYRTVEIDIAVPDGPMSPEEVDALLAGLREIAGRTDGRVRFYREAGELAGRLGRAGARAAAGGA